MMKNIGIIGFGKIALAHQKAFSSLGHPIGFSVNRSAEGRQKALDAGIERVYEDMHEAVKQEKPDALIVTVGFEQLFEVAKQLIPYGIPILLEKPSGTSLAEQTELEELALQHGNKVQLAVNRRFYSVFNKAIDDAGGIKEITSVDVEWSERPAVLQERGMQDESIAKIIFGNSIHGIDLLCWLIGDLGEHSILTKKDTVPFRWYMRLNGISDSGVIYSFNSSWDYPVPWRLILGTKNKRYQFAPLETCFVLENGKEKYTIEPSPEDLELKPGFHGQSSAFLDLINGGENKVPISAANSSMEVCQVFYEKLYES